ncbi:hypothetical protein AB0D66_03955 [Streptomyces sp. NPDC048270]|uniref:hypothetical protein n=1 Tax=Streptomyces sp. NPDC048270 TaxID=3154615 RepID=UPI0033FF85E4
MRPGRSARLLRAAAALYVALVAAGVLAGALTGAPPDATVPLYFATLPGSLLVTVFVLFPAGALAGPGDPGAAHPFGLLVPLVGGAVLNVLLVWAVLALARKAAASRRTGR